MSGNNRYTDYQVSDVLSVQGVTNAKEWHTILNHNFPLNRMEYNYNKFLYVVSDELMLATKIGVATNPHQRLRALQQGNPRIINTHQIWCDANLEFIMGLEKKIHKFYKEHNLALTTLQSSGHAEWFAISPQEVINYVNAIFPVDQKEFHTKKKRKIAFEQKLNDLIFE